jgi:serine/threonine-protein kinase RsbW
VRFETAVAEIGSNIVRHAYPPQGEGGPLRLRLQAFPDRVEAVFSDNGVPYRPPVSTSTPAPGDSDGVPPEDAFSLKEGGYGLELARAAVDDLDYQRTAGGENVWRLVKRL